MGNNAAPGINDRSGSEGPSSGKESGPPCTHRQRSPKDATAKQVALLLPQAGRNGEELQQMLDFRPFAFFYPSPFLKYLMLVTVSFQAKFCEEQNGCAFHRGASSAPPARHTLPPHARRARSKINGSALRFNYYSVGRGGEQGP